MTNDMYYIPILARALQQADTEQALQMAFEDIKTLGEQSEYHDGFSQFQLFMEAVRRQTEVADPNLLEPTLMRELMTQLATDMFDGNGVERQSVLDLIQSRPRWRQEYEQLISDIHGSEAAPTALEISVYREEKPFGAITFEKTPCSQTIDKVTPGGYTVSLATGRVIWQGDLTEQDLIWTAAFPGKPLDLAADTDRTEEVSTRKFNLLDSEITLEVIPGLESGRLKITVNFSEKP